MVSRLLAWTGFPGQRRFASDGLRSALARFALQGTKPEAIGWLTPIVYVEGNAT